MMGTPIKLEDLAKELAARAAETRRAVARGVRAGAPRARALLARRNPKDTGEMKRAWRFDPGSNDFGSQLGELYNDAPYAGVIEMGARPHPVSEAGQQAIFEWVKRHFQVAGPMPSRKKRDAAARFLAEAMDDEVYMRIAMAIVWKIRREGARPTYFVRDSLNGIARITAYEVLREIKALPQGRLT